MESSPRIPPAALVGMEDWDASLVWSLVSERLTWRLTAPSGEIRYLKLYSFDQEMSLAAERDRLAWAETRLPVPRMLTYGFEDRHEWLVTAGLDGVSAIDPNWLADPPRLVPRLAEGLRRLHALPIDDCPFDSRLSIALPLARQRLTAGQVDLTRDVHRDHGELTIETALATLDRLRQQREDPVVCHGDYCLPNVLLSEGAVSAYLDLGKLGVADRWWDLAIATWSVTWNLGPGWEDLFLAAYGVPRDPERIAFYRLLYDLLP